MPHVVKIDRPDVVALIDDVAERMTRGDRTEAVAPGLKRLLELEAQTPPLFGAHLGSVRVAPGVDLVAPALDVEPEAGSGRELEA